MPSGEKGNTREKFHRPSDHLKGIKHRIHKADPILGQALCGPYPARFNVSWAEVDCKNCRRIHTIRQQRAEYATE